MRKTRAEIYGAICTIFRAHCRRRIDWERLRRATRELIELCERIGDRAGSAYGHTFYGGACAKLFDVSEAKRHLEIATAFYDELGKKTRWRTTHLWVLGAFEIVYGSLGAGIDASAQCEALAHSIGYHLNDAIGANNLSWALRNAGRFYEAKAAAERAIEVARRIDHPYVLGGALCLLGAAERRLGEFSSAIEHLESGIAIERAIPTPETLGAHLVELVAVYALAGIPNRAAPIAAEALQLLVVHRERFERPQVLFWAAALACRVAGDRARVPTCSRRREAAKQPRTASPIRKHAARTFPPAPTGRSCKLQTRTCGPPMHVSK